MIESKGWALFGGNKLAHYFGVGSDGSVAACGYVAHVRVEVLGRVITMTESKLPEQRKCPKCAAKLRAEARREGRAS